MGRDARIPRRRCREGGEPAAGSGRAQGLAALIAAGVLWSCSDQPVGLPPASFVRVEPADTLIAPGDSVRVRATAFGLDGARAELPLTFTVDPREVGLVDSLGLFLASREGLATVTAREPGGVVGFSTITVAAVSSFAPTHASFGATVVATGAGFGPASTLRFGNVAGRVRSVSVDGRRLEAWVPWDAANGHVTLTLADGRAVPAPTPFFLTGAGDDALEPNGFDRDVTIPIPFENPYLVSRLSSMDHFTFTLFEKTPLTVRVSDRNEVNTWPLRLVAQLNRLGGVQEFVGVAPVFDFAGNERQDGVIARTSLGPGSFALRIFVAGGSNVVDRRYEIRVDTVAEFVLPPDEAEPDDAPPEAPVVSTPFGGSFTLENPWAVDYYGIDVEARSRVHVSAAFGGGLGVFLISGEESVTWQLSNGVRSETFRGAIGPFGGHSFDCTVDPGRYYVGVLENSGSSGPYNLSVEVEPTTLGFLNCRTPTLGTGDPADLRARGVPE